MHPVPFCPSSSPEFKNVFLEPTLKRRSLDTVVTDRRWFSLSVAFLSDVYNRGWTVIMELEAPLPPLLVNYYWRNLWQPFIPVVLPFIPALHSIHSPIWLAFLCGWLGCLRWQGNRVWAVRLANDGYQLWGWPMMDVSYEASQWWISAIWLANDNWLYVLASISYVLA